ncbi:Carbohydrate sulfotransferase 3-like 3 [Homarus americanus]|uniref:Carbohydrate sulfotransferase 3-like 3 n=1 Tax=Homarus americanus TaxID=6706 RepID=A0A8J5K542_HOMAM|nr:Carbohydrate sulfotransferase 3-like 3 [Homarus americanus]
MAGKVAFMVKFLSVAAVVVCVFQAIHVELIRNQVRLFLAATRSVNEAEKESIHRDDLKNIFHTTDDLNDLQLPNKVIKSQKPHDLNDLQPPHYHNDHQPPHDHNDHQPPHDHQRPHQYPKNIFVLSSAGRSGSSLLGSLVASLGRAMYIFEPLRTLRNIRYESVTKDEALVELRRNFQCDLRYNLSKSHFYIGTISYRESDECGPFYSENRRTSEAIRMAGQVCNRVPVKIIKTIRCRLQWISELLQDTNIDMKVIHLVRDPRGTMMSMYKTKFPDVSQKNLCPGLRQDLQHKQFMMERFPGRYMFIKGDVLRLFFHGHNEHKKTVNDSASEVAASVISFWNKARIPTITEKSIGRKVVDLFLMWKGLKKNCTRTTDTQRKKEETFCDELEDLFDVAHPKAMQLLTIKEDRAFLAAQREKGRRGVMAGVDKKIACSIKRREESKSKQSLQQNQASSALEYDELGSSSETESQSSSSSSTSSLAISPVVSSSNRKRATLKVITPELSSTLDRTGISHRSALRITSEIFRFLKGEGKVSRSTNSSSSASPSQDIPRCVREFLHTHMEKTVRNPYSTFRNTATTWQKWRSLISQKSLMTWERECSDVLHMMGHRIFGSVDNARNLSLSLFVGA